MLKAEEVQGQVLAHLGIVAADWPLKVSRKD